MADARYLKLMLLGYALTVAVEAAVLLVGLSRRHRVRTRVLAGVWLTACTYPVVWLVLPPFFPDPHDRWRFLLVAETFAPLAEWVLFYAAFVRGRPPNRRATVRDLAAVVAANLASFAVGDWGGMAMIVRLVDAPA